LAFRLIMAAIDGVASASGALQARAIRLDFRLAFVMCPPECAGVLRCSKHGSTILAAKAEQLNETLYASALLAAIFGRFTQTDLNVCFWHIAAFAATHHFVAYWSNNGQRFAQKLNRCAAIDPTAVASPRA
jgi:hypothetical protein